VVRIVIDLLIEFFRRHSRPPLFEPAQIPTKRDGSAVPFDTANFRLPLLRVKHAAPCAVDYSAAQRSLIYSE